VSVYDGLHLIYEALKKTGGNTTAYSTAASSDHQPREPCEPPAHSTVKTWQRPGRDLCRPLDCARYTSAG
jgi:hypothetical protein